MLLNMNIGKSHDLIWPFCLRRKHDIFCSQRWNWNYKWMKSSTEFRICMQISSGRRTIISLCHWFCVGVFSGHPVFSSEQEWQQTQQWNEKNKKPNEITKMSMCTLSMRPQQWVVVGWCFFFLSFCRSFIRYVVVHCSIQFLGLRKLFQFCRRSHLFPLLFFFRRNFVSFVLRIWCGVRAPILMTERVQIRWNSMPNFWLIV